MLEEKHITAASLLCAFLGIAILYSLGQAIEPKETNIGEINESRIGERIAVIGRIDWALEKENFVLLTLNNGAKIKAIKFNPTKEERALAGPDSFVRVIGKVQLYENELEIVAEEIKKW